MSQRRRWDDDDDDYNPVYRGSRNYEHPGASLGDSFGDAIDSVKRAASELTENIQREARKNDTLDKLGRSMSEIGENVKDATLDLTDRIGHEVNKATRKWDGDEDEHPSSSSRRQQSGRDSGSSRRGGGEDSEGPGSRRMLGNMPPGCFCDMRGYACPLHRGQEAWRFSQDFQSHVRHNVDPENASAKAVGIAGGDAKIIKEVVASAVAVERTPGALPTSRPPQPPEHDPFPGAAPPGGGGGRAASASQDELDSVMAQLVAMGFDPERVAQALLHAPSLEQATNLLLDDPHSSEPPPCGREPSPPPRVNADTFLRDSSTSLGAPPTAPPPPPPPPAATPSLIDLDLAPATAALPAAAAPAAVKLAPKLAPPPGAAHSAVGIGAPANGALGGGGGGGDLLGLEDLLSAPNPNPAAMPAQPAPPSAAMAPFGAAAAPQQVMAQMAIAGQFQHHMAPPMASRPPMRPQNQPPMQVPNQMHAQASRPAAMALMPLSAQASAPAAPAAKMGAAMGAAAPLPPGWHACTDPTTKLPYWFNTATQQSQWTDPRLPSTPAPAPAMAQTMPAMTPTMAPTMAAPMAAPTMAAPLAPMQFTQQPPAASTAARPAAAAAAMQQPTLNLQPQPTLTLQPAATGAAAAAASAMPSFPPEGSMGALPAGWHACTDPTHNRTYYFNTVTQQSQWIPPTVAAAVPLEALPSMSPMDNAMSPTTRRKAVMTVSSDLGGVGDMAASFGLPMQGGKKPPVPLDEGLL